MSYIDQNLMSGESVVYRAKLHWIVFSGAVGWAVVALLLLAANAGGAGALCLIIAAAVALVAYANYSGSEFGVTNKRVIIKVGVLRRHSMETLLTKIEGVTVEQGLLGSMNGYGTITVVGTGSTKTPFKNIANPLGFRRAVQEQIEASTKRTAASA